MNTESIKSFSIFSSQLSQLIVVFCLFTISCDSSTENEASAQLHVKFTNSTGSTYTITRIELQAMGKADEANSPQGEWGNNLLTNGAKLAPGEFRYFDLNIPYLHWSRYRLGVESPLGATILLHSQQGWQEDSYPSITHWGSDERTVSVTVQYDDYSGVIVINGWSDFAGIEN